MKITGLQNWILPVYQPYTTDWHTRVNVFYGGAGSGKSYFITQKLALKALAMHRRVLVVRKVGSTLKDSVWSLFLNVFAELHNPIYNINKTDLKITLINGSEFIFKGLDDSEKIKSITDITDIFVEEATELTQADYLQLALRLRSPEPFNQIHLAFNPISKINWCYHYFFESDPPTDCRIVKTNYKDNAFLPKEYINELLEMERRSPAQFKIYALGEFATLDRKVFNNYVFREIPEDEVERLPKWCGLDFGFTNDPTAVTWGRFDAQNKKLYITNEIHEKGLTNDKIARYLIAYGLSEEHIIADSAEPKSIAELRQLGIKRITPAKKGADSIIHGIDTLSRFDIIIGSKCPYTFEEFENYTWMKDKKTDEYTNTPVDAFNHHIDSIRYGIQGLSLRPKKDYNFLWNGTAIEKIKAQEKGIYKT